jgi:hypothetical protein
VWRNAYGILVSMSLGKRCHSEGERVGEINIEMTELSQDRFQLWAFYIGAELHGSNTRISWFRWKTVQNGGCSSVSVF